MEPPSLPSLLSTDSSVYSLPPSATMEQVLVALVEDIQRINREIAEIKKRLPPKPIL